MAINTRSFIEGSPQENSIWFDPFATKGTAQVKSTLFVRVHRTGRMRMTKTFFASSNVTASNRFCAAGKSTVDCLK